MHDRRALVLVAHGSRDPRFALVVDDIARQVRTLAPAVDVRVGYLDHGSPRVTEVAEPGAVAVPLLLAAGYHVRVDLPAQAPGVFVSDAIGPDPRLAAVLADRLVEAGYDGRAPVTLAAAGSADDRAMADVELARQQVAERLRVEVTVAFVAAGSPRLAETEPRAVATYLLAPGTFNDAVQACGADVIAAPLGTHPLLAEIVLDRYRNAQLPGRTAPA